MSVLNQNVATSKPQVSCYLKPGYKARLKQLAQRENRTMSAQAAYIIEHYLNQLIEEGQLNPIEPTEDLDD